MTVAAFGSRQDLACRPDGYLSDLILAAITGLIGCFPDNQYLTDLAETGKARASLCCQRGP
jgi:hypothetical protein